MFVCLEKRCQVKMLHGNPGLRFAVAIG